MERMLVAIFDDEAKAHEASDDFSAWATKA